jgi:hypothetical protein
MGKRVFYVTNNSSKTRDEIVSKCSSLGYPATKVCVHKIFLIWPFMIFLIWSSGVSVSEENYCKNCLRLKDYVEVSLMGLKSSHQIIKILHEDRTNT